MPEGFFGETESLKSAGRVDDEADEEEETNVGADAGNGKDSEDEDKDEDDDEDNEEDEDEDEKEDPEDARGPRVMVADSADVASAEVLFFRYCTRTCCASSPTSQ